MSIEAVLIAQVGTIIAVLLTGYFQRARDERRHHWDQEERTRIAANLAEQVEQSAERLSHEGRERAAILATTVETAANVLAAKTEMTTSTLVAKIDENTQISVTAFDTANKVNEKIAGLVQHVREEPPSPIIRRLDIVRSTTDYIKDRIEDVLPAGHRKDDKP